MTDKPKPLTPPYATFGTFISLFNKLRDRGVPSRIDPSVFGSASGSVSYSVIASLKSLKLIDEDGRPSETFSEFALASDDKRGPLLKDIIEAGYPSLFADGINLAKATASEFDEHIRKEYDVKGSTVDKIAAFFLAAATQAGIELSPHLIARKPAYSSTSSKKSAKQRKNDDSGADSPPPPPPPPPAQISEKALEYRLVDLMSEAAGSSEVMSAIITVITFLKTKNIPDTENGGE